MDDTRESGGGGEIVTEARVGEAERTRLRWGRGDGKGSGEGSETMGFAGKGLDCERSATGKWCAIGPMLSEGKGLVCNGGIVEIETEKR